MRKQLAAAALTLTLCGSLLAVPVRAASEQTDPSAEKPAVETVDTVTGAADQATQETQVRPADAEGTACNRYFYEYAPIAGLGHFIHTYVTDGNPIPTFQGEPERVEIPNCIDCFTNKIWESLNENNKISLYVRYIDLETGKAVSKMINKNV